MRVLSVLMAVAFFAPATYAQVLGPCGTTQANSPTTTVETGDLKVLALPLPGEQAPNFELDAVVGDQVKKIKLSDYDGKWRVVCFYPADFTFV